MTDAIVAVYTENETKQSWPIGQGAIYDENETELSWLIELGKSVTKMTQDNNVIDYKGAIYVKTKTKLSWLFRPYAVYDKNDKGKDRSYRCDLCQNRNWIIVID